MAKGFIGQTFTAVVTVAKFNGKDNSAKEGTVILEPFAGTIPAKSSVLDPKIVESLQIEVGKTYLMTFTQKKNTTSPTGEVYANFNYVVVMQMAGIKDLLESRKDLGTPQKVEVDLVPVELTTFAFTEAE